MKALKTIFTVLLYVLLVLLVVAAAAFIVMFPHDFYQWEWGQSFLLLFCIIGGVWFFRWLLLARKRDKARAFVEGVTEISSPQVAQAQQQTASLRKCWQRAMEELGKFASGRKAVYEFPWFLMLGESGCGKSQSLRGSRLRMNFDVSDDVAKSPFNLQVMKSSVFLDINGKLLDSNEESGVLSKLAAQICHRRPKEPVNGIVLCVKASTLANPQSGEISKTAQRLRDAVAVLQNNSQYRLPVYIMVTQIDALPGFARLAEVLPDQRRQQAMGMVNDDPYGTPAEEFVSRTITRLRDAMSDLRVEMAYNVGDDGAIVLLPASVASLSDGLRSFAAEFFDFNKRDEIPPLRGIFLGSAGSDDFRPSDQSDFYYQEMGLAKPVDMSKEREETHKAKHLEPLFLHDFFGNVLSANRWLYSPFPSFSRMQSIRRSLPLTAYICVAFILCLLMTLSFLKQSQLLNGFSEFIVANKPAAADPTVDPLVVKVDELKGYSDSINKLQGLNSSLWWSMLRQSFVLQSRLERNYAQTFRKGVIQVIDDRMSLSAGNMQMVSQSNVMTGAYFEFMLNRLNLDRLSAVGKVNRNTFNRISTPAYSALKIVAPNFPADRARILDHLYQHYYMWGDEYAYLVQDSQKYSSMLISMIENSNGSLVWLVDWIKVEDDLADITLGDFWGGNPYSKELQPVMISRAFTLQGRERLFNTLALICDTVDHTPMNDPRRMRIEAILKREVESVAVWYNQQVYASWLAFITNFGQGRATIADEDKFTELASRCAAMQGPYLKFLDRCTTELPQFCKGDITKMPPWLQLLMRFREMKLKAPINSMLQDSSVVQGGKSFLSGLFSAAKNPMNGFSAPVTPAANMDPGTLFALYVDFLLKASPVDGPLRRKDAYSSLKTVFESQYPSQGPAPAAAAPAAGGAGAGGANPAAAASAAGQLPPLQGAQQSFANLKKALAGSYGTDPSTEAVWNLLYGCYDLTMDWYCYEAAEYLQTSWNKNVIAASAQIIDTKKPLELFKLQQGLVWKWQQETAAPFITTNNNGDYVNNLLYGYQLPLSSQLLEMFNTANKGAWGIQDDYTVNISCLPTDVNPRSYEMPASVNLVMYTAKGPQTLKNVNLHASKTYQWKPADGGTVELQINFSSFMLVKRYSGNYGFAAFINEFRNGSWTFMDKDFPQSEQLLQDMNVDWIRVNFTFESSQIEPILRMVKLINLQAPSNIVESLSVFLKQDKQSE